MACNMIKCQQFGIFNLRYCAIFTFYGISQRASHLETWNYHHSMRLDVTNRMAVVLPFCDHWMPSNPITPYFLNFDNRNSLISADNFKYSRFQFVYHLFLNKKFHILKKNNFIGKKKHFLFINFIFKKNLYTKLVVENYNT